MRGANLFLQNEILQLKILLKKPNMIRIVLSFSQDLLHLFLSNQQIQEDFLYQI